MLDTVLKNILLPSPSLTN